MCASTLLSFYRLRRNIAQTSGDKVNTLNLRDRFYYPETGSILQRAALRQSLSRKTLSMEEFKVFQVVSNSYVHKRVREGKEKQVGGEDGALHGWGPWRREAEISFPCRLHTCVTPKLRLSQILSSRTTLISWANNSFPALLHKKNLHNLLNYTCCPPLEAHPRLRATVPPVPPPAVGRCLELSRQANTSLI